MGLIRPPRRERRSNPFENPGTPLTSVGLITMLGGQPTDSGVTVSEENSFSVATFWRAALTVADVTASFPLRTYNRSSKVQVVAPALEMPASGTPFEQYETMMLHLLVWGNSYCQKIRNGLGQIIDLVPIYPSRVDVKVVTDVDPQTGAKSYRKMFTISNADDNPYTDHEILHIPGPSIDGIRGMGVVEMARRSIGITQASELLTAKQFANGAMLSGMLTTDRVLKEEEATAIKTRWRDTLAGVSHAGDVFVGGAGTKFQPLSMSNADAQFLAQRQWQALDICRWFGLPPHLAMLIDKSTSWGTGIEQQNIGLLKFTIRPWTMRIEQRVTSEITGPVNYSEFDTNDLLKADILTRFQAYQFAVLNGWMTRNEIRASENLAPLEGLDVPLVPTVAPPAVEPAPPETTDPDADADAGADDAGATLP